MKTSVQSNCPIQDHWVVELGQVVSRSFGASPGLRVCCARRASPKAAIPSDSIAAVQKYNPTARPATRDFGVQ